MTPNAHAHVFCTSESRCGRSLVKGQQQHGCFIYALVVSQADRCCLGPRRRRRLLYQQTRAGPKVSDPSIQVVFSWLSSIQNNYLLCCASFQESERGSCTASESALVIHFHGSCDFCCVHVESLQVEEEEQQGVRRFQILEVLLDNY